MGNKSKEIFQPSQFWSP